MSNKRKKSGKVRANIIRSRAGADPLGRKPVEKAEVSTQITPEDAINAGDWINQPYNLNNLEKMVTESSILPQCIRAYKNNIAGFGIGVRYAEDFDEETTEMKTEYDAVCEVVELLNIDQDTKEVFEDIIEARETYGTAYVEVIRTLEGMVTQIEFMKFTPSVVKTKPLEPYQEYSYFHHGMEIKRQKMFRKYKQEINGQTVYYREFGDPRIMDKRTGRYVEELDLENRANEILEFAIGTKPYGEVRWIGQVLGVDGSRRAEALNNNYFINGRHTPLLIMVNGGTLTEESYDKLKEYMEEIKGESGQHAFIVLESENAEQRTDFETDDKPKLEVKDIASILQKDELFQEYLDNNRRRVQSAFQLPDLYVGYTTDFNRATAQTAQEVTEQQVFQPERKSLAWAINNRLLNCYQFKYCEVYFKEPDLTNPDDIYKIMSVANAAGGLTPNMAKEFLCQLMGEASEPFPDEWGDTPIAIQNRGTEITEGIMTEVAKKIEKASRNEDDQEIVPVLKEVYAILADMRQEAIEA